MLLIRLRCIPFFFASVIALGGSIKAAELAPPSKTSWPSFRHDLALTGIASSELPDPLELLWQVSLGDQIVATSAIVGEFVYVPCLSGHLYCLERATGKTIWSYKTVDKVAANTFAPGFKSSPTVTADRVYLGDEDGVFHAIDRATGEGRWKYKSGGEIYSSAAVADGRIVFGSEDGNLYCLDLKGNELWKCATQGPIRCSPAIVDGVTFVTGCDAFLRTVDMTTGLQSGELELNSPVIASPTVVESILYVGTSEREVVAVDRKANVIKWRYNSGDGEYRSSAAVTDQLVILGNGDRRVHAIHKDTGLPAWTFPTRSKVDSSPVVVGDRVFIGSNDGNLYELGLTDGKLRWKFNATKAISAVPAVGEGVLVVGCESRDGKVYCFGKK